MHDRDLARGHQDGRRDSRGSGQGVGGGQTARQDGDLAPLAHGPVGHRRDSRSPRHGIERGRDGDRTTGQHSEAVLDPGHDSRDLDDEPQGMDQDSTPLSWGNRRAEGTRLWDSPARGRQGARRRQARSPSY